MVGFLAAALALVVLVLGNSLRAAAIRSASGRLESATREAVRAALAGLESERERYLEVAANPSVHASLRGARPTREAELILRGLADGDAAAPVELWTADGRLVAAQGRASADSRRSLPPYVAETVDAVPALRTADSLGVSSLYRSAGSAHVWLVFPVRDGSRLLGFIARRRPPLAAPNMSLVSGMMGTPIRFYQHNPDSTVWVNALGRPIDPPAARADSVLISAARFGPHPLVGEMHVTRDGVLTRPRAATRIATVLSLTALLIGGLVAWLVARGMARPLEQLTLAAEKVAEGDYRVSVPVRGSAEMQRLAATFNNMAWEIAATRSGLEEQRERAEGASAAKSEFLTTMSHELRTPLNAIAGYVELLDMGLRGPLSPEQRKDLGRIRLSQQHLLALISRVLDLSRIEAGTVLYNLASVPVAEVVVEMRDLMAPQAASRGVSLETGEIDPALRVRADVDKLRQILLNLLANALRHTPPRGRVRIDAAGEDSRVTISVWDTGPGIPAHKRDILFEPFVQIGRSLTSTQEGLGLGLAISRDLARGMGGDLELDASAPGARFVATLPAASPIEPSRAAV